MTLCLDLPMPPSVNHIWRKGKLGVNRSQQYRDWIEAAGWEINKNKNGQVPISGHFESHVILSSKKRHTSDLDNRPKAIFDLLQSHRLIENDRFQDKMTVEWGEAPMGCKIFVWPCDGEPVQ